MQKIYLIKQSKKSIIKSGDTISNKASVCKKDIKKGAITNMSKYSVVIDFGTLSGRAVIVDINTGDELASAVSEYKHGVMSQNLPNVIRLPE